MGSSYQCTKMKKSTIIIGSVVLFLVVGVKASPQGGLLGSLFSKVKPKCGDGSKSTCTCSNGNVITRPRRNPCGDGTKPSCVCADGSTAVRSSPCDDGQSRPAPGASCPSARTDLIQTLRVLPHVPEVPPSVRTEAPSHVLTEQTWDSLPTS